MFVFAKKWLYIWIRERFKLVFCLPENGFKILKNCWTDGSIQVVLGFAARQKICLIDIFLPIEVKPVLINTSTKIVFGAYYMKNSNQKMTQIPGFILKSYKKIAENYSIDDIPVRGWKVRH